MSTSVPDGISSEALQSLMTNAKEPDQAPLADASPQELMKFVAELADSGYEQIGTGFAYKLIIDYCLFQLFNHHNDGYQHMLEKGDTEAALCWARDAGQLQAMSHTLKFIYTGDQDFLCPTED